MKLQLCICLELQCYVEGGAENCVLHDSQLNDVPETRLNEQMNYMNESSCRTDRRELNLDIEQ